MELRVGDKMKLEEGERTEFKMHMKNAIEDIPLKCQRVDRGKLVRTMQPNSKFADLFPTVLGQFRPFLTLTVVGYIMVWMTKVSCAELMSTVIK